jgi:hypothetical protein
LQDASLAYLTYLPALDVLGVLVVLSVSGGQLVLDVSGDHSDQHYQDASPPLQVYALGAVSRHFFAACPLHPLNAVWCP